MPAIFLRVEGKGPETGPPARRSGGGFLRGSAFAGAFFAAVLAAGFVLRVAMARSFVVELPRDEYDPVSVRRRLTPRAAAPAARATIFDFCAHSASAMERFARWVERSPAPRADPK